MLIDGSDITYTKEHIHNKRIVGLQTRRKLCKFNEVLQNLCLFDAKNKLNLTPSDKSVDTYKDAANWVSDLACCLSAATLSSGQDGPYYSN